MDRQYYKQYYHYERHHWWFRVRNQILINEAQKLLRACGIQNPKILNIGAATGRTTELLSEFGNVTTLEYDKACCAFLKDQLSIEAVNGSVLELPFADDRFDMVCAFDVIEHVEDDALAVKEIKRVCKNGGGVLLSVPMYMMLWSTHDLVNHHFRRYTLNNLKRVVLENGSQGLIVNKSYFNAFLFPPILLFRTVQRIFSKKGKEDISSDFSKLGNPAIGKFLYTLFSVEYLLLKFINFPFGVSGFIAWRKG